MSTLAPTGTRMAPPSGHSLLLISMLGILVLDHLTRGQNSTLIFTKENIIRNCSCPVDIQDCDYSLASLLCSCKTALLWATEPLSYSGHLTVWFTDASALGLLLNFTLVQDLKLSLCSANTLPTAYLAICGLKRLRINTEAKHPVPEQSLLIHSEPREKPMWHTGWQSCTYVSFLDMALFNRESSLRSYSIENVANIANNFPSFSDLKTFPILSNKSYVVTFIY
ncbi:exosomal polycystin-1-interacting protein [Saccopteryx leptura]|uniref:exosomal polycystin-1-interacting protein n=1 Tax=Saccopteryx leptura TaxID=249018 RepID=UPI00339C5F60